MEAYDSLAGLYDHWQELNNPVKWADYTDRIIRKHYGSPIGDGENNRLLMVDLGCGTGSFSIEMSRRGVDVLAIDRSTEMLAVAAAKEGAGDVQFICQDITDFELYGTVDLMVCYLDTVNHILSNQQLTRFFSLCKNYLNPDGILIFDMITPVYFKQFLADKTYFDINENYTIIWKNYFRENKGINTAELTAFVRLEEETYQRFDETIREKCYPTEFIKGLIEENELTLVAKYREFTFQKPDENTKRVFFVVKNKT